MAPRISLSRDDLVHRTPERKLESDCRQPLCLVKEHLVLQSAGKDRSLEIRQRCKKGGKGSKQGNRVNRQRGNMERHLEKHQKEQKVKVKYCSNIGFWSLKVKVLFSMLGVSK